MIDTLATAVLAESANSPGWFLVHAIGVSMGIVGLIFFLGTAVGVVRFPDFYTRMHAAGKGDTFHHAYVDWFWLGNDGRFFREQLVITFKDTGYCSFYIHYYTN